MSRHRVNSVAAALLVAVLQTTLLSADDSALWKEYGLVSTQQAKRGKLSYTTYQMKDLTGALAVWEWQRSAASKPCNLAPLCTVDDKRTIISDDNYVIAFDSVSPRKADVDAAIASLPNRKDTSLPALLTFLPRDGLVTGSARYILGTASLAAFAPELGSANPGFEQGAEAQSAAYTLPGSATPVRLALFYYPTPEMARVHSVNFKQLSNVFAKRSAVLVAVVYGGATQMQADTLLSRVQYEAKITWNDTPPPPPIKPLYRLLLNIVYMCLLLAALCTAAGLIYAALRIYRRRYGQLESQEAMTTLHLRG
ncbi:MAG TPA: DUF6599 family protein [Bryobacteraceae bacterium]|nr:DUF6599 family protein [Bryobacteraceae bacterium]